MRDIPAHSVSFSRLCRVCFLGFDFGVASEALSGSAESNQRPGPGCRTESVMKTVMVVDDVPANVDVVLGLLHESGYRVLVADSGFRGIEQLELELPDLILLDLMMPS
jgi:PleD family two-component response regulator